MPSPLPFRPSSACLALALVAGCSAAKEDSPRVLGKDAGADGGIVLEDTGTASDDGLGADVPDGGGVTVPDCPEELKQIYVVSNTNDFYRFDPAKLTMTAIGKLKCPSSSTPFSMAVDRKGTAWVLFSDGHIFHVSTKDASCKSTAFVADQAGFHTFGMAFATDGSGTAAETLYVANYDGSGIAKIDATSLKLTPIGTYGDPSATAAELSGTGEGRLFAFFNDAPVRVGEVNRTTGKLLGAKNVSGVTVGSGWAFAHWGGDFWLFTAPFLGSQVTQYDYAKGTAKTVLSGLSYTIVGAGVSTCAPTAPPPK